MPSLSAFSQDVAKGKELFNTNCAACHKLDGKATGPALRDVASKYDKEWLYKWIKNSGELIKSGDAQAVKVFEESNKVPMTAFPQLSNEDIDNILAYTSEPAPAARRQDLAQGPQKEQERGQEPPQAPAGNQKRNRGPCLPHWARGSAARKRQSAKRVTAQPPVGPPVDLAAGPPIALAAGQAVAAQLASLQMAGLAQQAAQAEQAARGQASHL